MKGLIVSEGGNQKFEFHEMELPKPKGGAVLAKIRLANICGSDMHDYLENFCSVGTCLGHEFVSEIAELGEGVTTDNAGQPVGIGDRIVCPYFITCMECDSCAVGDFQNCVNAHRYRLEHARWDAWPHFSGAFSTHYYIHPEALFYKVPDELPDEWVAGVNCAFSQVYCAIEKHLDVRQGETLLIQGAGGLGLYSAAIAAEKGAVPIVLDSNASRLELAKRFGSAYTVNMSEHAEIEDRVRITQKITGGAGVDKAMEVCGAAEAFQEGIQHMKVRGIYAVMGVNRLYRGATVYPGYIVRKALTIKGSLRYDPIFIKKSMEFMVRFKDKYPFGELCDGVTYPLKDITEVMRLVVEQKIPRAILKP
jgi:threonine dehydrogenase-like Zn-dependent dehydrogenase